MSILNKKIISNSSWMILEKIISVFGLIFVTSFVAKYIGPENFGKIAFVSSIFIIVQTITWFGNQEIAFKRISRNYDFGLKYLISTQEIRKKIFFIISIPLLFWIYTYNDFLTFIFGIATSLSIYFLTQDIYVTYNNATLRSYINAISNSIGIVFALIFRYVIVYFHLPIEFLAFPIVVVSIFPFLLRKYYFNRLDRVDRVRPSVLHKYRSYYLLAGMGLLFSNLAVSFYTQINNFLLMELKSVYELGIFNVAITLGMSWIFINNALITSIYSKIYSENNEFKVLEMVHKLSLIVILISSIVYLGLFFFGEYFVYLLYGEKYNLAYNLIIVIVFAGLLSSLGTIYSKFIIKLGGYSFISKKMFVVALLSMPVSYFMITKFGLKGAAYSMVVLELISLTLLNYFYRNGLIFKMHFFFFFKKKLQFDMDKV